MGITNDVVIEVKLPDFFERDSQKDKFGVDLRIKKIVFILLAAACVVSGTIALTAGFLPFTAFAVSAFTVFKAVSIITGIAIGIFIFTKTLDFLSPKLPRPLSTVVNHVHSAITEIFSLLAATACYFVDLEKLNPKSVEGNPQQPILLIHGLYHNSSAWIEYLRQFKDSDVGPVFTINLGNPFSSLTTHAEEVQKMVAEIQKITGRKDIMLVGHSMGGIVASKFALDFATEDTVVTDIVTIGSPLKGTAISKYAGLGKSVKEMHKGSNHTLELSKKILMQSKIRFFHIASETDMLVPSWTALFPENEGAKRLSFPNLGHTALLYTKAVIDPIIDYYKNRP